MVGLDTRATMDMDATIKGLPVNEESVKKMFLDICKIELQDEVTFEFKKIGEIREGNEYTERNRIPVQAVVRRTRNICTCI